MIRWFIRVLLCPAPPQLEMRVNAYRHYHGIAAHPVKLLEHGQSMLGAVDVLKQLHAKNAVDCGVS